MNISIIGTGYVGLVSGTCFAEMGNNVFCVDVDKDKIQNLKNNRIPIYELGLEEMVRRNQDEGRLIFTTDYSEAIPHSDICFIAVGTPPMQDGSADISYVFAAAENIAKHITGYTIVVNKSTVPVGTAEKVREIIQNTLKSRTDSSKIEFDIVSNPEFLKEGVAIGDFMRPDRVVIGSDNPKAENIMKQLYQQFTLNGHPIVCMDIKSAEMTKYAANAMLATRISFINEIAQLCDKIGGDVTSVRHGIGLDSRIGMAFLHASCGYGGSCFPKDIKELINLGEQNGIEMKIAKATEAANNIQKMLIPQRIIEKYGENLSGKVFAVWGLSFKPATDDMREAPSINIVNELTARGAKIQCFDPKSYKSARQYFAKIPSNLISYEKNMWDALKNADALILVTEWKQFRTPDFEKIKSLLKSPVIYDGRNQYSPQQTASEGIELHCIGRGLI